MLCPACNLDKFTDPPWGDVVCPPCSARGYAPEPGGYAPDPPARRSAVRDAPAEDFLTRYERARAAYEAEAEYRDGRDTAEGDAELFRVGFHVRRS